MNTYFVTSVYKINLVLCIALIWGCGAVGAPIPPEDVGIAAKVRKQQQDRSRSEQSPPEEGSTTVDEEIVELPAFYPIGTR